jgi:hypothetical protein
MKTAVLIFAFMLAAYSFLPPPRTAVESGPVSKALSSASSADRATVAAIYRALGAVTKRDQGSQIGTTAVWRSVHSAALRLSVGSTPLVGKYPGLDKAVEEVLQTYVTLENVPLASEVDKKIVWKSIVEGCSEVERQAGG